MEPSNEILLKTQQVARALGVSVSSIKRWVDAGALQATRTVGKHRLIPRSEAERFARDQGLAFEFHALEERPCHVDLDEGLVEELMTHLRRGKQREAQALIADAYESAGPVALGDTLIRPVMQRLGHEWERSAIDVYQEHRATRIVKLAIWELLRRFQGLVSAPQGTPVALGAAPENDPYMLPGMLCELTLRHLRWDVQNLGVNLPLSSLANAVYAHRPTLVWLSVSYLEDAERFVADYAVFHQAVAATGAAVMLGGQALTPEIRPRLLAAAFGERLAHLAEFARHLRPRGPESIHSV